MGRVLQATIAAVLLATTLGARAQDVGRSAIDDTPHITIVGSASTEAAPDLATITIGVTKHAPTAKAAAVAVAPSARSVVEAAIAAGVKKADIRTQSVNLDKTFEEVHDPQGRVTGHRPTGYAASETVEIRMRDLPRVGGVALGLIDKGANALDGIAFSVEHPQPIRDRLEAQAVTNARRQAEMVAQAAGVKLGRLLLIEPSTRSYDATQVFRFSGGATFGGPSISIPIEPGTQTFSAELRVKWAIDQP